MADSLTIAPAEGHALLFTQGGVGESPGYDMIDLRRVAQASVAAREGVLTVNGWKVTQNGGGAMSVVVDADDGPAVIDGDSITNQGRYVIAPHSANATLAIAANSSGNPRIDQIVLIFRDDDHDASGFWDARLLVVEGTPTSGATLSNRNGAAALPSNAIRLADILVANGASSILTAAIADRRPRAYAIANYGEGLLASRPTTPDNKQEIYHATDDDGGLGATYGAKDDLSGWRRIGSSRRIGRGSTATTSDGSGFGSVTIAHGLGWTPHHVQCMTTYEFINTVDWVTATAWDATNITIKWKGTAGGAGLTIYWMAVE